MSSVFVSFGQSGVGLGREFWSLAAREARYEDSLIGETLGSCGGKVRRRGPLFDPVSGCGRAIFVDGDERVIEGVSRLGGPTASERVVSEANCVTGDGFRGCGKCFAEGFVGRGALVARAEERLRAEAERCDRLSTATLGAARGGFV